ncbi:WD repeat-containing protein 91 homolog isoform X2 [Chenopodium quinoa]|nr:WD repeat-containing protein 91 homolog isoform X2 [Chenopodium quinoa]
MENMRYAEELVREFLVFRGFTSTLQAFEMELNMDVGKGFQVDKILDLIFSKYIPKFEPEKLVGLLSFFKQCISSSETVFYATLSKLEASILRYYIVHAVRSGRNDKVKEFFDMLGDDLQQKGDDWTPWFAMPYLKNPALDPQFRIYFSKEWLDALHLSLRNFLSQMFSGTRIPALMKISTEKSTINRLRKDIKQLNLKLSQLQAVLEEREAQLHQLRCGTVLMGQEDNSVKSASVVSEEASLSTTSKSELETGFQSHEVVGCSDLSNTTAYNADHAPSSSGNPPVSSDHNGIRVSKYGLYSEKSAVVLGEEEFSEVKVQFQETFLGHTSPISRSRFSASGDNIASASTDGTVRIWTYDSSTPGSRNATIYCGAEILSLDWDCKSDRLLLIGTAEGGIKAWNVDAKRVVCDLSTGQTFRRVLDIKCSPLEPIFVSAAASEGDETTHANTMGYASLTVWNMKTWKPVTVLPLGEEPPAITSMCFNHNGKILAAAAVDGMIHMFDMSAGLQITGWPAHDCSISSILFGHDETSIFTLGSDGKVFEWSLQNQGRVVWSADCSRFCNPDTSKHCRHEMALDCTGKRLLVTSDLVRSPMYQVGSLANGSKTLPHSAAVTTVDWHPTLPIYLTGSGDNSVRVTSIL